MSSDIGAFDEEACCLSSHQAVKVLDARRKNRLLEDSCGFSVCIEASHTVAKSVKLKKYLELGTMCDSMNHGGSHL